MRRERIVLDVDFAAYSLISKYSVPNDRDMAALARRRRDLAKFDGKYRVPLFVDRVTRAFD